MIPPNNKRFKTLVCTEDDERMDPDLKRIAFIAKLSSVGNSSAT